MTRLVLFITHAEVVIDSAIPVPNWPLSAEGRRRHEAFNRSGPIAGLSALFSSQERKATDAAAILSAATGLPVTQVRDLHENDRSATGYLPRAEFEATADAFFAHPTHSIRGWERACDAQARIVACVRGIVAADRSAGDIAIVAHGGVGALLLAHLSGADISRRFDQPGQGGGNWFAFDPAAWAVTQGWRDIAAG